MSLMGVLFFLAGLITTGVCVGDMFETTYGFLVIGIGCMFLGYRMMTTGIVADMQKTLRNF